MLSLRRPAQRFSLCLLDEGEDFVALWLGLCHWPKSVAGNWQELESLPGNILVCSKSIFFEPDDVRVPIARLPFKTMQSLEAGGRRGFQLVTSQVIKMKANMVDAPYVVEKGKPSQWKFSLACGVMSEFLPLVHQYLAASRLAYHHAEDALQMFALERANATHFDTSQLVDFTERSIYDQPATQHTPLVKELGRLVITDKRLYFQALNNVTKGAVVTSHPLAGIAALARRRSALQPVGLELFFVDCEPGRAVGPTWGSPSAFFAFQSEVEREEVYKLLTEQAEFGVGLPGGRSAALAGTATLEAGASNLKAVTKAWQEGRISNFDYLLFCNVASGRSFSDLTQYCVFPWVLSDYTSKRLDLDSPAVFRDLSLPMGAIDPQRLSVLVRRFKEMPREEGMDKPFLFGTHYSCPGYVMFWLVRAAPGHLLRLQNGRFDSADRLFIGIGDSYKSATSAPADIKELIPEFFMTEASFLRNGEQLALGSRQNGKTVGDVELPPWADSPEDFLLKHRAALESPYVSANLHHWLDLIFGSKQQGEAAEKANNVFHHLTYEGAVDINQVEDPRERHAIECQINEFGQCPKQIFSAPHPRRLTGPSTAQAMAIAETCFNEPDLKRRSSSSDGVQSISLALLHTILAATTTNHDSAETPGQDAPDLATLDVASRQVDTTPTASEEDSKQTTPSATADVSQHSPEAGDVSQRSSGDRLREHVSNVSGHLTYMVNTFAKDPSGSIRGAPQAAQSRLKGLFQRQAKPPRPEPPSSVRETVRENVNASDNSSTPPAMTSSTNTPDLELETARADEGLDPDFGSITDAYAGRDLAAEDLAEALNDFTISDSSATQGAAPLGVPSKQSPVLSICRRGLSGHWGPAMHAALQRPPALINTSNARVSALACTLDGNEATIFCALWSGALRVLSSRTGAQIRSLSLSSMPLTCILVWPDSSSSDSSVVLAGGFDNKVHAYSMEYGSVLGSWTAHDDTVSCLQLENDLLLTASHDGAVKAWSLQSGREPWKMGQSSPQICIETDNKITCMAANKGVFAIGSEDGQVEAWHIQDQDILWQVQVSTSDITSIQLTMDASLCITTDSSGGLLLLDVQAGGTLRCDIDVEAPLTCSLTDGQAVLTGATNRQVQVWEFSGHGAEATLREDASSSHLKLGYNDSIAGMCCSTDGDNFCLAICLQDGCIAVHT